MIIRRKGSWDHVDDKQDFLLRENAEKVTAIDLNDYPRILDRLGNRCRRSIHAHRVLQRCMTDRINEDWELRIDS